MKRLKGSINAQTTDEMVVIATLSARSALHSEHHQFEYEPPGELVVIMSMTAFTTLMSKMRVEAKPSKGSTKN